MLRDSCVYVKEAMPGDDPSTRGTRFCFKPSSTYTAECQDTGEQGITIDSSIVIDSTGIVMDSPEPKPSPGSSKLPDSSKSLDSPESQESPESTNHQYHQIQHNH